MFLHQFGCHTYNMLTFPVFHHVERLQGTDDVTLCDASHLAGIQTQAGHLGGQYCNRMIYWDNIYLRSLIDSVPLKSLRISNKTQDQ